jgi:hypothetical protein
MTAPAAPYAFVVWCDDIRQEVGNKPSFMGVYTGALVVPALPAVLPKLCIWATLVVPASMVLDEVSLVIKQDGQAQLLQIPPFTPEAAADLPNGVPTVSQHLMFFMTLAPLPLPAGCLYLEATVIVNGVGLPPQKLHIQAPAVHSAPLQTVAAA